MIKQLSLFILTCVILLSCTNGQDKIGTPVDVSQLPKPDSVSTLMPGTEDFLVYEHMMHASYQQYFRAELGIHGDVTCRFAQIDQPAFAKLFDQEHCPHDTIMVRGAVGRIRGIAVETLPEDKAPYLLLIMEDDHAERIALRDISHGVTQSAVRTAQGGITRFEMSKEGAGAPSLVGIGIDGSTIDLTWESVADQQAAANAEAAAADAANKPAAKKSSTRKSSASASSSSNTSNDVPASAVTSAPTVAPAGGE